jgi:hypothetical protein
VYLYHVLFITINICGIDGQKNSGSFLHMTNCGYWCWDFYAWFFLKRRQNLCPIRLIKKEFTRMSQWCYYTNYSPGIKSPNRFAPEITQSLASHLILSRITKVGESFLWKTLAFCSFQISQTVSNASDANPFLWGLCPSTKEDHQSWMLRPAHCLG